MAPPLYDDSKYQCCCCHVEKATYFIAFVGTALNVLAAVGYFFTRQWGNGAGAIISSLIYLSILAAYYKREPRYYLPYLVLNGISIALMTAYMILLLIVFIWLPDFYVDQMRKEFSPDKPFTEGDFVKFVRLSTGFLLVMTMVITAVAACFWHVVYRAYKYMKENE